MAQVIIDKQNGELAFRLEEFRDLSQFDHLQRKNYYSIIVLNDSLIDLSVDFSTFRIDGEYIVCISPYQPFMLASGQSASGYLLNFHPDFFCTYRHQNEIETEGVLFHNFNQPPYFEVDEIKTFHNLIAQMSREMQNDSIAQHEVLVAYLKIFLIESVRQKKQFDKTQLNHTSGHQSTVIHQLVDLIEDKFCVLHSPQEYAELMCLSSRNLAAITKKFLNQTLSDLIISRVIIEAKRELYLTSKTIKEVSALLGYQDEFYFSRLFKKKVGVSPDVYRKTVGFAKLEKP
ncbi:MAG: AraC family transcriptional regulator [Bacteroidota bacterium]